MTNNALGLPDKDIRDVVESEGMKLSVVSFEAAKKLKDDFVELQKTAPMIKIEGMDFALVDFDAVYHKDHKAKIFVKIRDDKRVIMYAPSDDPDADQLLLKILPGLVEIADKIGYNLIDSRTEMTELVGLLKRKHGVTTEEELLKIIGGKPE